MGIRHCEISPAGGVAPDAWTLVMTPRDTAQAITHVTRRPIIRIAVTS
jgi:hypothetical protein